MKIFASVSPGETRVMAVGDVPLDYAIGRPGAPDGVGDLHRGRIIAKMPALAGSFVRLAEAEGFLPDSDADPAATAGSAIGVRVVRAAQGGKGPRLTARLTATEQALVGAGPPALLRRGPGAVERIAALHPDAPVLIDDAAALAELRPALGDRLQLVPRAFDEPAEATAASLAEPSCDLPNGLRMTVFPTPALTAIDIDLGTAAGGNGSKTRAHAQANFDALPAIAREIRLRNLGGAIYIDFAGLSREAAGRAARRSVGRPGRRPAAATAARVHRPRARGDRPAARPSAAARTARRPARRRPCRVAQARGRDRRNAVPSAGAGRRARGRPRARAGHGGTRRPCAPRRASPCAAA